MEKNTFDDIFADFDSADFGPLPIETDADKFPESQVEKVSKTVTPTPTENMREAGEVSLRFDDGTKLINEDLSHIRVGDPQFDRLIQRCAETLNALPYSGEDGYSALRREICDNRVEYGGMETPGQIGDQLAIVQAYKDRVFEIYAEAHRNHTVRKRICELLLDAYSAISSQSSQDKRRGEASLVLGEFVLQATRAEAFFQFCKEIALNLESRQQTLSRRLTCMQLQANMGNYDFASTNSDFPSMKDMQRDDLVEEDESGVDRIKFD